MYDLHLHSIYSDGIVTVDEIVESIEKLKLNGFAITDHDTINGISIAKKLTENSKIEFIPGIEFGITINSKEVHILGYFIDINNDEIKETIFAAKENRIKRTKKILNKLNELNISITEKDLKKYSKKDIISRSHIAYLLVDKGICATVADAFRYYLGVDGLAYIPKISITSKEIITAIKDSGGVAILAHPGDIRDDNIVLEIIEDGIDGLEIINSKHSIKEIEKYYNLTNKYKLIQTCGSDCHGKLINGEKFIGRYALNEKNIKKIKNLHFLRI